MKFTCTLFLAILLFGNLSKAQTNFLLDETGNGSLQHIGQRHYEWNIGLSAWDSKDSIVASYNSTGLLSQKIHRRLINSIWQKAQVSNYTYNSVGQLSVVVDSTLLPVFSCSRSTYTYSANQKVAEFFVENLINGNWQAQYRIFYTYTSNDLVDEKLIQDFINGAWVNRVKEINTYNTQNLLESEENIVWITSSNQWRQAQMYSYGYNASNLMSSYTYGLFDTINNSFVNQYRYEYNYKANNQLEFEKYLDWNIGLSSWENAEQYSYVYDAQGNVSNRLTETYAGSANWNLSSLATFSYDMNHRLENFLFQVWQNSNWKNSVRSAYTRNASGYTKRYQYEVWDNNNSSWRNSRAYDNWFIGVPLSVDELQVSNLEVFPNPSSNQIVYVRTDKSCFYQLYDISGNQLQSGYLHAGVNQLSILQAPGYYFLKVDHKVTKVILK